jgi:hypothetical protein
MRRLVLLVSLLLVTTGQASASPRVDLQPAVMDVGTRSSIAVSGIAARSLEVRLVGATHPNGTPLPWRPLALVGGVWRGVLQTPALYGVYPVELRTAAGSPPIRPHLFVRVFEPGTSTRPSFDDPVDVVRWWVRAVPHGTVVALKAWPRPAFDRRDLRLHRLFVVAYSPRWDPDVNDRLGMFITVVRDGYSGRWRLLEATVEP